MSTISAPSELSPSTRRASWLKGLLVVHWMSSAVCLLGLLLFSVTGITLNHAGQIEARPSVVRLVRTLPADLVAQLSPSATGAEQGLPPAVSAWLSAELGRNLPSTAAEWSADEIYLPMPRPGGDAWLRIGLPEGEVEFEETHRGAIAWLNDLHKGRHTGPAWSLFIDALAVGCLLFALSGLLILQLHAARRSSTWPLVGLGCLLPCLIVLLFLH